MRVRGAMAIALLASLFAANPCFAQANAEEPGDTEPVATAEVGPVSIFAGVRLWMNKWDVPSTDLVVTTDASGSTVLQLTPSTVKSDYQYAPIPVLGIRWRNFLASAAYTVETTYESDQLPSLAAKRWELDVNLGYFVLPSVLLSLGYKTADVENLPAPTPDAKIDAVLLGFSATAPLSEALSLYGNFAYGIAKQKNDIPDAAGETDLDGSYQIGEIGVSYRLLTRRAGQFLKSLVASIGYRFQVYETKDVTLPTFSAAAPTQQIGSRSFDARTTTDGLVVGLVAVF